jgi:hypothetical protein
MPNQHAIQTEFAQELWPAPGRAGCQPSESDVRLHRARAADCLGDGEIPGQCGSRHLSRCGLAGGRAVAGLCGRLFRMGGVAVSL